MKKKLTPAERLIVAADFRHSTADWPGESNPDSVHYGWKRRWVREQVLKLADRLKGTGVYLKVNSALRACGYDLIGDIHSYGLLVFADLKLYDIANTLADDAALLREARPELVTVVCSAGVCAMQALESQLPDTEILGITVLTSLKERDTQDMFSCPVDEAVKRLASQGLRAGIDGFVCAPKEARALRSHILPSMTINTPGIRPSWVTVSGDDQNPERVMTPAEAIQAGADRIVVGRPITQAKNPYDAVMRTIEEIASAVS